MSNVIIDKSKIDILANAIAAKSGESVTMTLDEMVSAVDGIETGGGIPTLETVTKTYTPSTSAVTDTITPSIGYDGLDEVDITVNAVPLASLYVGRDYGFYTENGVRKWRMRGKAVIDNGDGYNEGYINEGTYNGTYTNFSAVASGTSVTPAESTQTVGGAGYMMEGAVTVNAIPSNYVGSGITQRTSSDLSESGATVTAPAGYYASAATKTISSGSATPTASISATGASVSTGTNTLTLSKTVSNTPQVSAGYISAGTAGNSSVSLTASVTTKAAATITPGTSDQTIASGTYLTGTQTISGDANLVAGNIKSGTTIFGVTGTYSGGGGSGLTLLKSTSLGTLSTTSTSATDTGKSMTVTGYNDYDVLVVDVSVDTATNGRHTSTVSFVILTGTSNVTTKNTYTVGSNKWNSKLSSSGTASTRQSTSAYGIYANAATVSGTTMTITFYYRYNNNNTGTINNSYTARVYGLKLIDLIGG